MTVYAIIEDGGKQYKVAQGETVCVEVRDLSEGQSEITFDSVIFYQDGEKTLIGQPRLAGAQVKAKINGVAPGPKLYPMHFKRRKNSRSRTGHRQKYLEVEVTEILAG